MTNSQFPSPIVIQFPEESSQGEIISSRSFQMQENFPMIDYYYITPQKCLKSSNINYSNTNDALRMGLEFLTQIHLVYLNSNH